MNQIKALLKHKYQTKQFTGKGASKTVELIGAKFLANSPCFFGKPNEDYIKAEIAWYESQSLNVNDLAKIYGKRVAIWDSVADSNGLINSNYGWCIYSDENNNQFYNAVTTIENNPDSRQASMIYTRPTMHIDSRKNGKSDFMCTNAVTYYYRNGKVDAVVQMRSNDIVYGYNNDYAWQTHVLSKLCITLTSRGLKAEPGLIHWNAGSLHIYERHFHYLEELE